MNYLTEQDIENLYFLISNMKLLFDVTQMQNNALRIWKKIKLLEDLSASKWEMY